MTNIAKPHAAQGCKSDKTALSSGTLRPDICQENTPSHISQNVKKIARRAAFTPVLVDAPGPALVDAIGDKLGLGQTTRPTQRVGPGSS